MFKRFGFVCVMFNGQLNRLPQLLGAQFNLSFVLRFEFRFKCITDTTFLFFNVEEEDTTDLLLIQRGKNISESFVRTQ